MHYEISKHLLKISSLFLRYASISGVKKGDLRSGEDTHNGVACKTVIWWENEEPLISTNSDGYNVTKKLTTETLEQGVRYVQSHWRRSGIFIVNFEHISHLVLVFLLFTLNM